MTKQIHSTTDNSEKLIQSIEDIKQIKSRSECEASDGGSSGRSDTNDK